MDLLWNAIGRPIGESREAKLSLIRNPVIRVVAKIISNILFAKEESGSMRRDELMLIHYGLPPAVHGIYTDSRPSMLNTNMGAIFAENLVNKKWRGLKTDAKKVERIGSLLTPIFMFHGIDLSSTPAESRTELFDEKYFKSSGILKPGYIYQFKDRRGTSRQCKLPFSRTALTSEANLLFDFAPEVYRQTFSEPILRGSSSGANASQPHLEDDPVPDTFPHGTPGATFPQQSQTTDETEYALPPYRGEYALPPLAANATDSERLTWLIESQRKTHSMMERIWGGLARISCPRPPACFRATQTRDDRETAAPAAHDPDVAGHRISDDEDTDELSDPGARLARPRRGPGQSRSVSPADH